MAAAGWAATRPRAAQPNIVLILADDLGYGDLGVQGDPEARTPNIDALAAQGVRFTSYYADHPVCSPSRAALLTGRYQHRMGFEYNSGAPRNTSPLFGIPTDTATIAERLKRAGYATAMFGKWHVGFEPDRVPTARGFDTFYGFLSGQHDYTPRSNAPGAGAADARAGRWGGGQTMLRGTTPEPMPAHTTEAFAAEAVRFIDTHSAKPFFLYLAFNAVHAPLDTTPAYEARFVNVTDPTRRTHLAQLAAMDDAVGQVLAAIDRDGLSERTLVIFTSDNGGPTTQTTSSNRPLTGVKGLVLEGGIRVPAIMRWPGLLPAGRTYDRAVMGFDLSATTLAAANALPASGLDGVDLLPFLTGTRAGEVHKALYWRSGSQGAVRAGSWKAVKNGETWHLFDLSTDLAEHRDLASRDPARLGNLKKLWSVWSAEMTAPRWVRNQLSGGDPPAAGRRAHDAIEAMIRGDAVALPDEE